MRKREDERDILKTETKDLEKAERRKHNGELK